MKITIEKEIITQANPDIYVTAQFKNEDYLQFVEKFSNCNKTCDLNANTECQLSININKAPSPVTKSMTTATATAIATATAALQSPNESMANNYGNNNKIESADYPCLTLPYVSSSNDNMCNETPLTTAINRLQIDCNDQSINSDQSKIITPMENIMTNMTTATTVTTVTPKARDDLLYITQTNHTTTDHKCYYSNLKMVQTLFVVPTFAQVK